jgi:N utilization substance protein B
MALDAIFAADLRKINPIELLEATAAEQTDRQNQKEIVGYAKQIVVGVTAEFAEIDDRIEGLSHKWSVDRMPVAVWELLYNDEVPDPVAIKEAVDLAIEYSTEESGSFVNGLLRAISGTKGAI